MKLKLILSIVIVSLVVIFSLQNSEVTEVNFLFWTLSLSRVLIILGAFGIGVIVGLLVAVLGGKKQNDSTDE